MWGRAINIGARPFKGVCLGDFKYQHWLPEIAYPTFNVLFFMRYCYDYESKNLYNYLDITLFN